MRRSAIAVAGLTLVVAGFASAAERIDEMQLIQRLLAASASMAGAAGSVQQSIVDRLAGDLVGAVIEVPSVTITDLQDACRFTKCRREWFNDNGSTDSVCLNGFCSPALDTAQCKCSLYNSIIGDLSSKKPSWDYWRANLTYEFFINPCVKAEKHYPNASLHYELFLKNSDSLRDLRIHQKGSFSGVLASLEVRNQDLKIVVIVDSITAETHMLRCSNGHEFAPSSGFRFCPLCGAPLE